MTRTEQSVFDYIHDHYDGRVVPEGVSFFTPDRKRAAGHIVDKGMLDRVSGPMGSGWRVSAVGLKTKIVTS